MQQNSSLHPVVVTKRYALEERTCFTVSGKICTAATVEEDHEDPVFFGPYLGLLLFKSERHVVDVYLKTESQIS